MTHQQPETSIALDMEGKEVATSLLALTEHLMIFPPRYSTTTYNIGVNILFQSIRQALDIDEDTNSWETGVM